ncbi:Uncharacterised protein [Raoultella planticola]|uniref:Uncharacterized protein n=1 Tax=Raoultella planticola TaxID=575 RepID=A0A8G2A237_RAOPL|nr:Uncharacterised protein [Raoultella planticola]
MQERGGSLRIHAGALHFPDRTVCRTETDDPRPGRFRQQTDGPRHGPELGGFPHPGIALNHREPVRGLQYHPGGSTLP